MYFYIFINLIFGLWLGCSENSANLGSLDQKKKQGEGAFGTEDVGQRGLVGEIYRIPRGSTKLPNFDNLNPIGSIVAPELNISPRSFSAGFPSVPDLVEWFGIRFRGTIMIPKGGCDCNFAMRSDDGSRLYIDSNLVIDNDGQHDPVKKKGSINLTAGRHPIVVEYYQGPRDQIALQLYMKLNSSEKEDIVPATMIDRP